jgi:hypothetical protein
MAKKKRKKEHYTSKYQKRVIKARKSADSLALKLKLKKINKARKKALGL